MNNENDSRTARLRLIDEVLGFSGKSTCKSVDAMLEAATIERTRQRAEKLMNQTIETPNEGGTE